MYEFKRVLSESADVELSGSSYTSSTEFYDTIYGGNCKIYLDSGADFTANVYTYDIQQERYFFIGFTSSVYGETTFTKLLEKCVSGILLEVTSGEDFNSVFIEFSHECDITQNNTSCGAGAMPRHTKVLYAKNKIPTEQITARVDKDDIALMMTITEDIFYFNNIEMVMASRSVPENDITRANFILQAQRLI